MVGFLPGMVKGLIGRFGFYENVFLGVESQSQKRFAAWLRQADASNFLPVAAKSNQKVRLKPPAGVPSEKSRLNVSVALFRFSGG